MHITLDILNRHIYPSFFSFLFKPKKNKILLSFLCPFDCVFVHVVIFLSCTPHARREKSIGVHPTYQRGKIKRKQQICVLSTDHD